MSIIGSNILAGASGQAGYNLNNSLRFRSSASGYLSRTPATSNRRTFTYSAWVKRGILDSAANLYTFFSANAASSDYMAFYLDGLRISFGGGTYVLQTTQVFRDPSAWYHIVVVVDTTQATAASRIRLYINGNQVTAFGTATYPTQNYDTNYNLSTVGLLIGQLASAYFYDGYMTEINFVDGQALTPSSFGETSLTTGSWIPKKYTGSYGTNGFYLNFSDTSAATAAAIGKDSSGNGNNWTPSGISVTAGVTYDAMIDVPTNTSATVANYSVMNPIWAGYGTPTFSNANLTTVTTTLQTAVSTMTFPNSSKTYLEATFTAGTAPRIGIRLVTDVTQYGGWVAVYLGEIRLNDVSQQSGLATFTTNDVIGIAVDLSANTLQFYKNNVAFGTANTITNSSDWVTQTQCNSGGGNTCTIAWNFGQRPFTYTPPTGFVALNTYNLPTPTILQGNKYMDATLYTGTGSAATITNAAGFKPDFVWLKSRSNTYNNGLFNSISGVNKVLVSNSTDQEQTETAGSLTAFNSNGFGLGSGSANYAGVNINSATYVGWQWQAGQGTTSSNTSGTITSTVSVNATAGFSVVTYTGTGANATVGHGLGVAPKWIIVKKRSAASSWVMYHGSLAATQRMILETTAGVATDASVWNSTAPTSSVFSLGNDAGVNGSAATFVAYCWAEIAGFSKFTSYTGNGSADGPFIFTNFQPRYVMFKRTDTTSNWNIYDGARNTYNATDILIAANNANADASPYPVDFLSNGIKLRSTLADINASGGTYIYACFASNPFKNSNAR